VTATYGTRWRRTSVLMLLGIGVMAAMLSLVKAEVLAAQVTYQGSPAKFSTSRVTGQDVGFGMSNLTVKTADGTASTKKVLAAGFATGTLDGFCLSQVQNLPVVGDVVVKVSAGDGNATTSEIRASNVQFDITELRGAGTGLNLDGVVHLGVATEDITTLPGIANPLGGPTGTGYFGIDATAGDIYQAKGYLYDAEIGGPMSMPGLEISVTPKALGGTECWSALTDAATPH